MRSRSRKISDLISNFSVAASTTRSQSASLARSSTEVMRPRVAALSATVILFFATSRSRFLPIVSRPRSTKRCSTSQRTTLNPLRANTWAMPLPIVPAPITPTRSIAMIASLGKPLADYAVHQPRNHVLEPGSIQLPSNSVSKAFFCSANGLTTVTPFHVNPAWRSSERSRRQPAAAEAESTTASQICKLWLAESSAAMNSTEDEVSISMNVSCQDKMPLRAAFGCHCALRTNT